MKNPNNPPPPIKRRRKIFRSQSQQKVSSNLFSLENSSDPVCDKPLQIDPDKNNVGYDARVPPQSDEQKRDIIPSNSTSAEEKYFPIFNPDLTRQFGSGKQRTVRKEMKLKVIPPQQLIIRSPITSGLLGQTLREEMMKIFIW